MGSQIERAPPPPDVEDGIRVGGQICNSPHVAKQDHRPTSPGFKYERTPLSGVYAPGSTNEGFTARCISSETLLSFRAGAIATSVDCPGFPASLRRIHQKA